MDYCTVDDVKDVLRVFREDFEALNIPDSIIERAIDDGTLNAKLALTPKYELDSLESDLPFAVNRFATLASAKSLIMRVGLMSTDKDKNIIGIISDELNIYRKYIQHGLLVDDSNNQIAVKKRTILRKSIDSSELDDFFEGGNRII